MRSAERSLALRDRVWDGTGRYQFQVIPVARSNLKPSQQL